MTLRIVSGVEVAVTKEVLWSYLIDFEDQPRWMKDAVEIRVKERKDEIVGTVFETLTKVGPLKTLDVMRIVNIIEYRMIEIEHRGLIGGRGFFEVHDFTPGNCLFYWIEELDFPWYLGGPIAEQSAGLVLRKIFQRDLNNLRDLVAKENPQPAK
ncbi:MAG: SRPBCC family protein [Actinomycetota bacterium]|nr:SRPBCC family protein [Actinomycetota bacterium]